MRIAMLKTLIFSLTMVCCLAGAAIAAPTGNAMNKADLSKLLGKQADKLVENPSTVVKAAQGSILVETSLWHELQRQAEVMLSKCKGKRAAIVLMEAETGRILVMAGVKGDKLDPKVALDSGPPAASLFKIVTAAAAVEETSLKASSMLNFVGRPHTLYQHQILLANHPQGTKISLRQGFADSNNPVFAKLGIHLLGKDLLAWYGKALGFETKLPFELPLGISALCPAKDQFALGEMASGFNRETTISPVHAAMLGAVFINGGRLMEPYIIKQVSAADGGLLYQGGPRSLGRIVSTRTARQMQNMFEATISEGTARSYFRDATADPYLKSVVLGGKTGTISRANIQENYEWFVGYGKNPHTGRTLAVACLVVHGKVKGGSAKYLARVLLRQAFSDSPTRMVSQPGRSS